MASTNETTSTTTHLVITTTVASTTTTTQSTTSTTTATTGPQTPNYTVTSPPKGLAGGQIAGIVVGSVVFVIIIIVVIIVVILAIKRRRRTQRPISGGEVPSEQNKERDENKKKRAENKYVKKDLPKIKPPEIKPPEQDYENSQGNYYNVEGQNREELSLKNDSDADNDKTKGSRKPAVMKQDSVPAAYAPPPPIVQASRTSMPVEIAPNRPVIEEDEYIIPEDLSKINIAKQPVYIEPKRQDIDGELYIEMKSTPGEELYMDPDSGQDQEDYMNFDAKSKTVKDEEKTEGPKDYVNLSNQEKGVAFGVKPKPSHVKPKREATPPVTTSDAELYQNVEYENSPKQSKKTKERNKIIPNI